MKNKAFTLVELLIVIAVIAVIASVIIFATAPIRDKARIASTVKFDETIQIDLSDNLVSSWSFDDVSGTDFLDPKNRNDLSTVGTVPTVEGVIGNAVSFDGSKSNYLTAGNPSNLQITGNLTISMWIYPLVESTCMNPLGKAYGGEMAITQRSTGLSYYTGITGDNSGTWGVGYVAINSANGGAIPPVDKWTHVAAVRDMDNLKLRMYIDGELVREDNLDPIFNPAVASLSRDLLIGNGYCGGVAFDGYIDEVRIYDEAYE